MLTSSPTSNTARRSAATGDPEHVWDRGLQPRGRERESVTGLDQACAWQIKSMGDGVMIWAPDAGQAMALAAQAVNVGTRPDLLPVRVGVDTGAAVMRGCDWYGSAVNVAARLAPEAEPNEALVSAATRDAVRGGHERWLGPPRELVLRGVDRPIGGVAADVTLRNARAS